jgi:hypothetical protein
VVGAVDRDDGASGVTGEPAGVAARPSGAKRSFDHAVNDLIVKPLDIRLHDTIQPTPGGPPPGIHTGTHRRSPSTSTAASNSRPMKALLSPIPLCDNRHHALDATFLCFTSNSGSVVGGIRQELLAVRPPAYSWRQPYWTIQIAVW